MLAKPLILILVYLLSIINLLILFLPIAVLLTPLLLLNEESFRQVLIDITVLSFVLFSFLIILYLFFDLIFGISIFGLTKNCKRANKYLKKYDFVAEIINNFKELQKKFKQRNIKLLISKSDQVNAYAVGSMRRRVVVITLGLIKQIRKYATNEEEFQDSIKAIMAHELSHLLNKDFLPTLLVILTGKITKLVEGLIITVFNVVARLFHIIPILGGLVSSLLIILYKIITSITSFFYRFIILNVFAFLKLHVSRATEYRCDYQAALASGGEQVAKALSFLGDNGFVTIFATHPRTKNRMKKVANVQKKSGYIRISLINKISNFLAIMSLILIFWFSFDYVKKLNYFQRTISNPYYVKIEKYFYQITNMVLKELKKN